MRNSITLKKEAPLLVPASVQRKARLKAGDQVVFQATPGKITIVTKGTKVTPASSIVNDEYTPEQRKVVEAQVSEGLEDIQRGRVSRRFDTVDEMLLSMKAGRKGSPRRRSRSR